MKLIFNLKQFGNLFCFRLSVKSIIHIWEISFLWQKSRNLRKCVWIPKSITKSLSLILFKSVLVQYHNLLNGHPWEWKGLCDSITTLFIFWNHVVFLSKNKLLNFDPCIFNMYLCSFSGRRLLIFIKCHLFSDVISVLIVIFTTSVNYNEFWK